MDKEFYLRLLGGDIDIALDVCKKAAIWGDRDPVVLIHAAEVLAGKYRELKKDLEDARYHAKEHCETCQNSEWADMSEYAE
jgi:hypothetical protein